MKIFATGGGPHTLACGGRRPKPNQTTNESMKLLPFQRRDFAAAALRDGVILSLEQGLGKSFAAFTIPFIWRSPRVLLVAPGDLHNQLKQTAARFFGLALIRFTAAKDPVGQPIAGPASEIR